MSFQFINNGKIDGVTRKRIRSHVMRGKNVGKIRIRSAPNDHDDKSVSSEESITDGTTEMSSSGIGTGAREVALTSVPRMIGDSYSTLTFHDKFQPYMSGLLTQFLYLASQSVYPVEFCLPMPNNNSFWIEYLQSNEAFFHTVLAMSEACVDAQLGRQETSPRVLYHLSNTYRCLNQNLQKHRTPSDSTIASVMTMAIHDDFKGHIERGKVHMDALQLMVKLRGGMTQFKSNHFLTQKICRADIQYALYTGTSPRFYRDEFPYEAVNSMLNHADLHSGHFSLVNNLQIRDSGLRKVLQDLSNVCYILNGNKMNSGWDPFLYQEILISVTYRLLHYDTHTLNKAKDKKESAISLGLLAFMTTLLFQSGRFQPLSYDLLAHRLRDTIEVVWLDQLLEYPTFLWLLFISGISVLGPVDRTWLLPHIKIRLQALEIHSWQTAREMLRQLPWIGLLHDKAGLELWQALVWG